MKDARTELWWERNALERATRDIRDGEERIRRQHDVIANLQDKCCDTREAERFLILLRQTLEQWEQHRALILQRIVYLEASISGSAGVEHG